MYCIEVKNLIHQYFPGTPLATTALMEIDLAVVRGEFLALVGASGSGKSTLVQHFNGLLQPTAGRVLVLGRDVADERYRKGLWQRVGLVFQFPERQIFSATVYDDVAFGPRNKGLDATAVSAAVTKGLEMVDLTRSVMDRDPQRLSGGMQRRVAIAGVLAIDPEILILDEPGAGLDPRAKKKILDGLKRLQREHNTTIILITHELEDVAAYAGRVAVLKLGRLLAEGTPAEILGCPELLKDVGFDPPPAVELYHKLTRLGLRPPTLPLTGAEALEVISSMLKAGRVKH